MMVKGSNLDLCLVYEDVEIHFHQFVWYLLLTEMLEWLMFGLMEMRSRHQNHCFQRNFLRSWRPSQLMRVRKGSSDSMLWRCTKNKHSYLKSFYNSLSLGTSLVFPMKEFQGSRAPLKVGIFSQGQYGEDFDS